jgi:hypothetical protein
MDFRIEEENSIVSIGNLITMGRPKKFGNNPMHQLPPLSPAWAHPAP